MSDKTKKPRSRLRSFVLKLTLALSACLLTVLAIDTATFFLLGIKGPGYGAAGFFDFSPLLGHFQRPNAEGYWHCYNDGTKFYVKLNSFGFADAPRTAKKTRPRIALIGDSTSGFWETDEADRGQFVIERALDDRFEVLNFGVRGYGTDQTLVLFEHVGRHFSPDIVVYTFCINDIDNNAYKIRKPYFTPDDDAPRGVRLAGYPIEMVRGETELAPDQRTGFAWKTFLQQHSLVTRKLWLLRRLLTGGEQVRLDSHFELQFYQKEYSEAEAEKFDLTKRVILRLADAVQKRGMKFLVVENAYKPVLDPALREQVVDQYGDQFDFDRVTAALRQLCDENGIEFVSLAETIRQRDLPAAELFHPEDNLHLNKRGIQVYADTVVEKLDDLGWADDSEEAGGT